MDFTKKNLNDLFWNACRTAWNRLAQYLNPVYHQDKVGLFSYEGPHIYVFSGPKREEGFNRSSLYSDIYAEWFPGSFEFTFDLSQGFIVISEIRLK